MAFYRREPGAAERGDWKPARPPASAGRVRYPTTTNCGLVRQFPPQWKKGAYSISSATLLATKSLWFFCSTSAYRTQRTKEAVATAFRDSHFGPSLARTISCYIT